MEQVCPLCNGLAQINQPCPNCGIVMEDKGALENFYGPYSPFQELDSIRMLTMPEAARPNQCVHLIACSHCGLDQRVPITQWLF